LLAGAVLTGVLGWIFSQILPRPTPADKIFSICTMKPTEVHKDCFTSEILTAIDKDPAQTDAIFSGLWQLAIDGRITDDPRIFSDIAHEAGMQLAEKNIDLKQAFQYCGSSFKQGCMHGVIMEYVDNKYHGDVDVQTLKKICEGFDDPLSKNNCIHGLGHELAAKVTKNLSDVLDLCEEISTDKSAESACESGVLMEYSKGTAGSGQHSHEPVGQKELPCRDLPDKYQEVCYVSQGSYGQYNPGQQDFVKSYEYCSSIPEAYVQHCMLAVSERAVMAAAENIVQLNDFCEEIKDPKNKKMCQDSLISVSKTQFDDKNFSDSLETYVSENSD